MARHTQSQPTFSTHRRWVIGLNLLAGAVALLAIVAMLNYLAAQYYWRGQWTVHNQMKLSPQTVRVLRSVTNEVKITVFFDARGESELHSLVTALLKEYNYVNPRLAFRTVDPARQPGEAQLVLAAHKLGALKDRSFIVFDCDGRTKVIYQSELSEYDIAAVLTGQNKEFRRTAFRGEMLFTTAIVNLINPRQFKVCFLQGHGEHDPALENDRLGYGKFAEVLRENGNLRWEPISLLGTNPVPADCQLLIVAGPSLPLGETELGKISDYLKQGGRLFAILNNMSTGKRSGLENVLKQWGVLVLDDMVSDSHFTRTGDDVFVQMNPAHPIMKALVAENKELGVRLIRPRAVGRLQSTANPNAPSVEVLARASKFGAETDDIQDGVARYPNTYQSQKGGLCPLMVAVEQGSVKGVSGSTRIVAVGDSLFLDNELIDDWPLNHYFASQAVNWLLDRPQILLEGLVPRPLQYYKLTMTRDQLEEVRWIFLAAIPGSVLLFGALVWWRRRR